MKIKGKEYTDISKLSVRPISKSVAKDITSELVKVLGGKVDTKTLTSVINEKMKG